MPRAKTRQSKRKPKRRGPATRSDTEKDVVDSALLAITDELHLINRMLGCAPVIDLAVQTMDDDPNTAHRDSMAYWIKTFRPPRGKRQGAHAPTRFGDRVDPELLRDELLSTPDAVGDLARWRLQQVIVLLEVLFQSSSGAGSGAGGGGIRGRGR